MKKVLVSALAGLAMLATFVSCGTTGGVKVNVPTTQVIDHQGALGGLAIPEWVKVVMGGVNDAKTLGKYVPGLEDGNSLAFVVSTRSTDLDMAEVLAQEVELKSAVAASIQNNISTAVEASLGGEGEGIKGQSKKAVDKVTRNLSSVTLKGLQKQADYWVQAQKFDNKGNPIDEPYYEYYLVGAIDKDLFEKQLQEAVDLEDTATESQRLKDIIAGAISDQFGVSVDLGSSTAAAAPAASTDSFSSELAIESLE